MSGNERRIVLVYISCAQNQLTGLGRTVIVDMFPWLASPRPPVCGGRPLR